MVRYIIIVNQPMTLKNKVYGGQHTSLKQNRKLSEVNYLVSPADRLYSCFTLLIFCARCYPRYTRETAMEAASLENKDIIVWLPFP